MQKGGHTSLIAPDLKGIKHRSVVTGEQLHGHNFLVASPDLSSGIKVTNPEMEVHQMAVSHAFKRYDCCEARGLMKKTRGTTPHAIRCIILTTNRCDLKKK